MLRKRTRSHQKDQNMNNLMPDSISELYFHSDFSNQKHKNNSFLKVPGLFVGSNPRNPESDSVRSPTSPLDFRIFSSLGNPFRCLRTHNEGQHRSWDCSKVGLSIIDSLDDEPNHNATDNKNVLFGRQMSARSPTFCSNASSLEAPKSLPSSLARPANPRRSDSDVVFEIGEAPFEACGSLRARSIDSGRCGSHLVEFGNRKSRLGVENTMRPDGSSVEKLGEIEMSEDYTCVRTHGPNPKVKHIFGDCVLECHNDDPARFLRNSENDDDAMTTLFPSEDFLKFCYSCKKKLDGEDIYMYRGEKAFCSSSCRAQEIEFELDEDVETTNVCEGASTSSFV